MRVGRQLAVTVLSGALVAWCLTGILFVDETEQVIVERLGRIVAVYDRPADRGLHLKFPWPFELVRRFDRRVQAFSPAAREVFTQDRKNLIVEPFLCWRIADGPELGGTDLAERPVVRFYRGLGSLPVAEARLSNRLQSILTTALGRTTLADLVAIPAEGDAATTSPLSQLSAQLRESVRRRSDEPEAWTERLGIELVDVRIHRLQLPAGNLHAVYERMRSERQKQAERYRSAGLAESTLLRSQAERQAGEILARAKADADKIRSAGEAEALGILNGAYARDPQFAQRLQALDAYRELLNERTTLVLSADNPLWRWLLDAGQPQLAPATPPPPAEPLP